MHSTRPAHPARLSTGPLPSRAQQAAFLAPPVTLFHGFTLVVQLFALGDREQEFRPSPFIEVKLERNQRHALAIDRTHQLVDLLAMKQQLSRALRLMIEAVALQV